MVGACEKEEETTLRIWYQVRNWGETQFNPPPWEGLPLQRAPSPPPPPGRTWERRGAWCGVLTGGHSMDLSDPWPAPDPSPTGP